MTAWAGVLEMAAQVPAGETYGELLRSGPHWLFEGTLELLSAPLAFALGWLWRNGLLRHLHRDLQALVGDVPRECLGPMSRQWRDGGRATQRDLAVLTRQMDLLQEELRSTQALVRSGTGESQAP